MLLQAAENLRAAEAEVDLIGHQNEQMFRYVRACAVAARCSTPCCRPASACINKHNLGSSHSARQRLCLSDNALAHRCPLSAAQPYV